MPLRLVVECWDGQELHAVTTDHTLRHIACQDKVHANIFNTTLAFLCMMVLVRARPVC
jgi:hypothetical protein